MRTSAAAPDGTNSHDPRERAHFRLLGAGDPKQQCPGSAQWLTADARPAGDPLVLDLPLVPVRLLADHAIGGVS
ncbi:MAG TPA: hypothetical protein VIV12_27995 [Streptosporangiaceae bacterium]